MTEVNDRIRMTMEDMLETMRAEVGAGIAGPQVGVMRRMFVAEPEPGRVYYMINPVITEQSWKSERRRRMSQRSGTDRHGGTS